MKRPSPVALVLVCDHDGMLGDADHVRLATPPIRRLLDWEEHGAVWRSAHVSEKLAIVELCSCTGEVVDELRSDDSELVRYLTDRPRSEP